MDAEEYAEHKDALPPYARWLWKKIVGRPAVMITLSFCGGAALCPWWNSGSHRGARRCRTRKCPFGIARSGATHRAGLGSVQTPADSVAHLLERRQLQMVTKWLGPSTSERFFRAWPTAI